MERHFDIIGAPFNKLGYVTTESNTVDGLRRADDNTWMTLSNWMEVRRARWGSKIDDVGDVVPSQEVEHALEAGQNEQALMRYSEQLSAKVQQSLIKGHTPITIGGDHSIAVGTLMATLKHFQKERGEKVAVVWVDAHADCNSSLESNLHGKPLAMLTNEYQHNGWAVDPEIALPAEHIFYVGVRDFMLNEWEYIQRSGVTHFDMEQLDSKGIHGVVSELLGTIEAKFDRVYLSFDYDALDGSIYRACATPNVGGLSAREALHLVHSIARSDKFVGADFVEFLPELDSNGVSKELMTKLVDAAWGFRI